MATITLTRTDRDQTSVIVWTPLLNGDDGQAYEPYSFRDASIAFTGNFGVGGTIVLEGSNDGANWFTLTDLQTIAISKTAAALEGVAEATRFVRPRVTAGDGATSLTATLYVARSVR